jgi:hypothetical protein
MAERTLGRSVWAVAAGFLTVVAGSLGLDVIMHATGVFPPWGQPMSDGLFAWATVYRLVITVLGGYVTAVLAPRNPIGHALVLGGVGFVAAALGAATTWNQGPEFGPKWYPILLVVTAIPCTWLGGLAGASRQRPSRSTVASA